MSIWNLSSVTKSSFKDSSFSAEMEEFIHVELKFLRLKKYLKNKDEDEDDLKNWETDPKEEEDTIWKIRSEKRKFKEEK